MARARLVIGNRNYSSWSLRGWLIARAAGLDFEEVVIPLGRPETKAEILRFSPSGRVPCLVMDDLVVWETLAIGETLAVGRPELWPDDPPARAHARAVSNEMHAGFTTLRLSMPMNARAHLPGRGWGAEDERLRADIARIDTIWNDARTRFGGKADPDDGWLYGRFGIADAMFAPVVLRFATYEPDLSPLARDYVARTLRHGPIIEWVEGARREPWVLPGKDLT